MRTNRTIPTKSSQTLSCGICGRRFFFDETDAPPFCSERCKMIDLGRWLDEDVSLPHEGGANDGEFEAEQAEDEEFE